MKEAYISVRDTIIRIAEYVLNKDLDDRHWYPYISAMSVMFILAILLLLLTVLYIRVDVFKNAVNTVLDKAGEVMRRMYHLFRDKRSIQILAIVMVLIPFLATIFLGTPSSDDFVMITEKGRGHLLSAIRGTAGFYMSWGGGIPGAFYQLFFNPLVLFDINSFGMGIVIGVLFLIYVSALFIYVKTIFTYEFSVLKKEVWILVYIVLLFCFLSSRIYNQVFYWFVGSSYLLMYILVLINQIFIYRYLYNDHSLKDFVLLCVFGFFACFGYQYAVFSGIIYLFAFFSNTKKGDWRPVRLIPLGFMVLGGILSAFSPGNMARHDSINKDFQMIFSFTETFKETVKAIGIAFMNPFFIAMIIIVILIGILIADHTIRVKPPLVYLAAGVISLYACIFPVVFGQGAAIIVNRIEFVENSIIYLWGMITAFGFGSAIGAAKTSFRNLIISNRWRIVAATAIITLCMEATGIFKDNAWIYSMTNVGNVFGEREHNMSIINQVIDSDEMDVVVYETGRELNTGIINPLGIIDDPDDGTNIAMANYLGKNSIALIKRE